MKKTYSNIVSSAWGVMIFVTLLVSIPSMLIFLRDYEDKKQDLLNSAETKVKWIQQYFESEYSNVLKDLEFFSRNPGYVDYLTDTTSASFHKRIIEKTSATFVKIRNTYYQFRLVDTLGVEALKIKYKDGKLEINTELQNKLHRPYLIKASHLKKGEVYITDFDLNVENGQLERPFRPVVRFITPVFDQDKKIGYLVLNYNANRILSKMADINPGNDGLLSFVTHKGYFIREQARQEDFAFLINGDTSLTKAGSKLLSIWKSDASNRIEDKELGLSYFQKVGVTEQLEIPEQLKLINQPFYYTAITYPPDGVLDIKEALATDLFLWDILILVVVIPIILYLFKTIRQKSGQLDETSRDLKARNKELEKSQKKLSKNLAEVERLSHERQEALIELQNRENDLKKAQEIAQLGYYERDITTDISTWSDNLSAIYGLDEDYDFNTQGVESIMDAAEYEEMINLWRTCVNEEKEFKTVYRIFLKNGVTTYLQDIAQPIKQNDKFVAMRGTVQNITERIQVEKELLKAKIKAEAATQAKSDFLATMSHEIRTPLNAVLGMASLLEETELDPKQSDFVKTIKVSGSALLGVINDILDFSKMESGQMEIERRPIELNSLLEDCLQVIAVSAEKKKLKLFYQICSEAPSTIYGDEGRLRQCLINLLNNAIKFTEKGEVKIEVHLEERDGEEATIRFSVMDTGIGIDPEKQKAIFNAFQQADTSITRRYGGSGLGLAITQRLVELMGGSIQLKSEPYEGSEFYIILKTKGEWEMKPQLPKPKKACIISMEGNESKALQKVLEEFNVEVNWVDFESENFQNIGADIVFLLSEPDLREDFIQLGESLKPLHDKMFFVTNIQNGLSELKSFRVVSRPVKVSWLNDLLFDSKFDSSFSSNEDKDQELDLDLSILVAEDNPVNQKLTLLLFENLGYHIDLAENGLLAVKAAQNKKYDLVFMDIQMPEMDGVEAAKYIMADHGKNAPTIIALTANAMHGDKEKYINAGMDDYLSKPINVEELKRKINYWGRRK